MNTKEKAVKLAKSKSVREHSDIWVYKDTTTEGDYYVSPQILDKDDYELVEKFEPESYESDSESVKEIEDYSTLERGDQVLINGENSQEVLRTSERQIITNEGKYRKSDGGLWGNNDSDEKITHKVLI